MEAHTSCLPSKGHLDGMQGYQGQSEDLFSEALLQILLSLFCTGPGGMQLIQNRNQTFHNQDAKAACSPLLDHHLRQGFQEHLRQPSGFAVGQSAAYKLERSFFVATSCITSSSIPPPICIAPASFSSSPSSSSSSSSTISRSLPPSSSSFSSNSTATPKSSSRASSPLAAADTTALPS
nr:hypothetical protein Iba_chr10aCG7980 [Ipomoea batatas]